jgi:phosphomannomutase
MTLIQSISGIRGTLGGKPGEGLSPVDIVQFVGAFGMWLKHTNPDEKLVVVIGRDARVSGNLVNMLVIATLQAMGIDVIDGGVAPTPTVAMGVTFHHAHGGIVITASHNPKNWNALKFLDHLGECLACEHTLVMQTYMVPEKLNFATVENLGKYSFDEGMLEMHIEKILALPEVDIEAIRAAGFTVALDGVNSCGGVAIPLLLDTLGVKKIIKIYCEPNGQFPHNPEPLPENLVELSLQVTTQGAHVGFAVDPDADRLAIVCEDGEFFGEEYTLVAVADYILSNQLGNTVSNLSSTQALKEITIKYGGAHFTSAVGEVNVVAEMKKCQAIIGGEGNGGVVFPALHYGRDALVAIALFLTSLAKSGKTCSMLKKKFPEYYISKNKIELPPETNMELILDKIREKYQKHPHDSSDGVKVYFDKEWVHLRKSNTEAVIRIYAESDDLVKADNLGEKIIIDIRELLKGDEE